MRLLDPQQRPAAREALALLHAQLTRRVAEDPSPAVCGALAMTEIDLAALADAERPVPRSAEDLLREARGFARREGDHERGARVELELGQLLLRAGRLDVAEQVLTDALRQFPRATAEPLKIRMVLAHLARRRGNWQRALDLLDEDERGVSGDAARGADRARFHQAVLAQIHGLRAQVWTELGVWENAAAELDEERALASASGDLVAYSAHLQHRAEYQLATFDVTTAANELEHELSAPYQAMFRADVRAGLRGSLGTAQLGLEQIDPRRERHAEDNLLRAAAEPTLANTDRASYLLLACDIALREGRLDAAAARLTDADPLLAVIGAAGATPPDLQEVAQFEEHRMRLLLAQAAPLPELAAQRVRLEQALDRLLDCWASVPVREGGIGFLFLSPRRQLLSTLIVAALALDGEGSGAAHAVDLLLRAQAMGSSARERAIRDVTLEVVRTELLGDGEGVVVFLAGPCQSHALAFDRGSVRHFPLADRFAIEAACRRLNDRLERCSGRGPSAVEASGVQEAAAALRDLVMPHELEAMLARWRAATFVGVDQLRNAPLECLPLREGGRLGERLAVAYLPSLPLGVSLARSVVQAPGGSPALALFAATRPFHAPATEALPALPLRDAEIESLTASYRGQLAVVRDADATIARVLGAELSAVPVVQFLMHGCHDPQRERGAGLVLADGQLFCEDVERNLRLGGLVILCACGAARGPERVGDDRVTHLGGAFLNVGASAVVLTRGDLEFSAAMDLMQRFHDALAGGRSPAEALRVARAARATASGGASLQDAAMHVIGLAHRPVFATLGGAAPSPSRWPVAVLVISAVAGVLAWQLRRRSVITRSWRS